MKTVDTTDCPCRTDPERNNPMYRTPEEILASGSKLPKPYLFRTNISL